ncbi:hypothetical protein ACNQKP_14675 [Bdellovibrio bacteriovorus]|uniref:hypothetical protein n=1 Tax=Bdellovibrio bacteriovorus TaxID=959 RepID=UPI003AA8B65F
MVKKEIMLFVGGLLSAQICAAQGFQAQNILDPNQPENIAFEQQQKYKGLFDSDVKKSLERIQLRTQISVDESDSTRVPVVIKKQRLSDQTLERLSHPNYQHPSHAAVFLLFRLPNQFRTQASPQSEEAVTTTVANTMIHPSVLQGKDGTSRYQYVDHLGKATEISLTQGDQVRQLKLSLRLLNIAGSASGDLALYPVSDRFIEKIHSLRNLNDPYARHEKGLDRVVVDMRDAGGESLQMQDGETYVLPLLVDYSQFKKLYESDKELLTLNAGIQGQAPVSSRFQQAGAGTYANVSFTREVGRQWLMHFALGFGANVQKNISGGYQHYDGAMDLSLTSNVLIGLTRVDSDLKGKTSLVVFGSQSSSYLEEADYAQNTQGRFVDRQSRMAMFRPDRRFGLALVRENQNIILQIQVAEDYIDSANKVNGLNHEDFQVAIRVSRKL